MPYDRPEPLEPHFGCGPFVPPPPLKKGEKPGRCGLCRSKNGIAPDGSKRVCMWCYSVAPEVDMTLAGRRSEAARTRELERREIENHAAEIRASRKSSKDRSSPILTPDERRALVAEDPKLESIARAWLDSIGQPVEEAEPAESPKERPAWKRRKRQLV